ncbi:MAG: arsenate reductase ArsC [Brevundimonas sp.]
MPVPGRRFSVLFLCTGNSARSIIAESVLRKIGGDRFIAHSAGSFPKGQVHPIALRVLESHGYPTDGLRSKSWDEFAAPGADPIDIVITVCDNAAGEVCPVWPGHPVSAHYGLPDPAEARGTDEEVERAFNQTFKDLLARLALLAQLHINSLDRLALRARVQAIHDDAAATPAP